jgi:hypothetical protein
MPAAAPTPTTAIDRVDRVDRDCACADRDRDRTDEHRTDDEHRSDDDDRPSGPRDAGSPTDATPRAGRDDRRDDRHPAIAADLRASARRRAVVDTSLTLGRVAAADLRASARRRAIVDATTELRHADAGARRGARRPDPAAQEVRRPALHPLARR